MNERLQTQLEDFENLEALKERLRQLKEKKKKIEKFLQESECPSCDFAVAAGWIAYFYDDPLKGEEMKKKFLEDKITFEELFKGMNPNKDENAKLAYEYIKKKFDGVMDTYFSEWEET